MKDEQLDKFFQSMIAEGQSQLADHIRRRLLHLPAEPDLLQRLDFSDDEVFLEPLLFSYLNSPRPTIPLAQIMFGYMPETARPTAIDVVANESGLIELPRIGYLEVGGGAAKFRLCCKGPGHQLRLLLGNTSIPHQFRPIATLAETPIEVCRTVNPLYKALFTTLAGQPVNVVVGISPRQHERLSRAIAILRSEFSHYFNYVQAVTKRLVVFEGEPYSFASIRAHGLGFISASDDCSTVFYLEDVVHQCGHIIFNAVSLERDTYLAVDPHTPLRDIAGTDADGDVYGAFHGLFTQMCINQCFRACLRNVVFSGRERHELCGRFADDMKRFVSSLQLLGRRAIYTDLGWWLFSKYRSVCDEIFAEWRDLILGFDTSNQPYIFDYAKFIERNPRCGEAMGADGCD